MTKLSRTQLLHKLFEDNQRVISLHEHLKTLKCDCTLTVEKEEYGDFKGHDVASLFVKNFNGITAYTGTSEYNYTNCIGFLAVDFKKCFNKWSQVPIRISLNRSNEEIVEILTTYNTKKEHEISEKFGHVFWDE